MSVIRDRASESSFDVDALAAELSLSRSALYAAFARTGRTPARAIRAARTAEARAMLARRPSPSSSDLSDVARLSGLGTSRRLRAALDSEARSSGAGN
ncbi:helix-turn-helix domain-containing protein [Rathayibacter tanaceti]|nr:helix-turn-helix domain-containing protein [Rathayibacter tanaceti]KZX21315.1 Helix-turn-helix domain protein [Rathayibacter tanaceti]